MSGRSFVITGANSGIGKATANEIAKRGQHEAMKQIQNTLLQNWISGSHEVPVKIDLN